MSAAPTERTVAVAHLKFARVGPRKLRRVADAIRGKTVREALVLLKFSGVFASEPIEKLLRSAVANANERDVPPRNTLFVARAQAGGIAVAMPVEVSGQRELRYLCDGHPDREAGGAPPALEKPRHRLHREERHARPGRQGRSASPTQPLCAGRDARSRRGAARG